MAAKAEKADDAARIVSTRPRFKTIDLQWPIAYAGKEYTSITITRLTAADVAKFQTELEAVLKNDANASLRFPLYRDETGAPIPEAVLDALDDDDKFELDRASIDFLPRRFRVNAENDTAQDAGGNTGPSSAE